MFGYFFWWADGVMYGPRFYAEAMPFLVMLTARGFAMLGELGGLLGHASSARRSGQPGGHRSGSLPAGSAAAPHGYNYVSAASVDAVARANIHNAVVFTDPGPPAEWWNYGMVFSANSPLLDGDVLYARDLGAEDQRLMALYPDRRFYRLYRTTLAEIYPGDSP